MMTTTDAMSRTTSRHRDRFDIERGNVDLKQRRYTFLKLRELWYNINTYNLSNEIKLGCFAICISFVFWLDL